MRLLLQYPFDIHHTAYIAFNMLWLAADGCLWEGEKDENWP